MAQKDQELSIAEQRAKLLNEKREEADKEQVVEDGNTEQPLDSFTLDDLEALIHKVQQLERTVDQLTNDNLKLKGKMAGLIAVVEGLKPQSSTIFTMEQKGGGYFEFYLNGEPYIVDDRHLKVQGAAEAEAKLVELNGGA